MRRRSIGRILCIALLATIAAGVDAHGWEREMEIHTGHGSLFGTLVRPDAPATVPAVLIVAGSGPTDKDGNDLKYGIHSDLYKIIANGLAEQGIASLRYDKRGLGPHSAPDDMNVPLVVDTWVDDVVSAQRAIEQYPGIGGLFILGHSEGGLLSVLAAHKHAPRGLILLAAPGRSLHDLMREQFQTALPDSLRPRANEILDQLRDGHPVTDVPPPLQAIFNAKVQPYLISELSIDPARVLREDHVPTLIIQGMKDLQVRPVDAERLNQEDPDTTLLELPDANHVLRDVGPDRASNIASYTHPELPIDARVIPAIAGFVHARMK